MRNYYLGGARREWQEAEAALERGAPWGCRGSCAELFLDAAGAHFAPFPFADLAILLRGYATFPGAARLPRPEDAAQTIREHYLLHGELPVEGLEGSFTVA